MKNLYNHMINLLTARKQHLDIVQKQIKPTSVSLTAPVVHIRYQHGKHRYFLQENNGGAKSLHYLSPKEETLIRSSIQSQYLSSLQKRIEKEDKTLSKIIQQLNKLQNSSPENLYDMAAEPRKKWITPYIIGSEEQAKRWAAEEFTPLQIQPENSVYFTDRNERVRSKSELLIANKLNQLNIPYKYEKKLELKGLSPIYPDFTVFNKRSGKEIYIEHLGLMGDPDYRQRTAKKLDAYALNGLFLGESLLIFYESSEAPLNIRVLEATLKHFCL